MPANTWSYSSYMVIHAVPVTSSWLVTKVWAKTHHVHCRRAAVPRLKLKSFPVANQCKVRILQSPGPRLTPSLLLYQATISWPSCGPQFRQAAWASIQWESGGCLTDLCSPLCPPRSLVTGRDVKPQTCRQRDLHSVARRLRDHRRENTILFKTLVCWAVMMIRPTTSFIGDRKHLRANLFQLP